MRSDSYTMMLLFFYAGGARTVRIMRPGWSAGRGVGRSRATVAKRLGQHDAVEVAVALQMLGVRATSYNVH